MIFRGLIKITVVIAVMSSLCRAAVNWVEMESCAGAGGGVKAVAGASGGSVVAWFERGTLRAVPIHLDQPMPRAMLYLRYGRGDQAPGSVDLYLAPVNTTRIDAPGVRHLQMLSLPYTGGWEQLQWTQSSLGELPAGDATILIVCNDAHGAGDLDVAGVANDDHHGLWQPSNELKDGKIPPDGILLPAVAAGDIQGPTLGNLISGDICLAGGAAPETFTLCLKNRSDQEQTAEVSATLSTDSGKPIDIPAKQYSIAAGGSSAASIDVKPPDYGWYTLRVNVKVGEAFENRDANLCVIRPAATGVRPQSMFGLNIGPDEDNLKIASEIGVKWRRGIPDDQADSMHAIAPQPGQFWPGGQAQIDHVRDTIKHNLDAGMMCLGYINYAPMWLMAPAANGQKNVLNRPTDMNTQAEVVYQTIKPLHDLIGTWEIWNEPWIHSWTWPTGTAQDYRDMTRAIWDRVKPEMPDVKIVGGGSVAFHRDVVFAKDSKNAGYLDGLTNHPYGPPGNSGPSVSAQDSWMLAHWSKGKGDGGLWYTEFGTFEGFFTQYPEPERKFMVARALAPLYSMFKLGAGNHSIHLFAWLSRYGEGLAAGDGANWWNMKQPMPAIAAYSAMTHFLEDAVPVRDIYSSTRGAWAIEFSKPDGAVITAYFPADKPDGGDAIGTMTLPALDFEVYDYLGRKTGSRDPQGNLTFPVRSWEVRYLVSHQNVDQVRDAFLAATWTGISPLFVNPRSFTALLPQHPPLRIKVENLLPRVTDASLDVQTPDGLQLAATHAQIKDLQPGEVRFVEFAIANANPNQSNRYSISYTARADGVKQQGRQMVQVACAEFGTPKAIDGDLSDWADVIPVTMISHGKTDYGALAADPTTLAKKMAATVSDEKVVYKIWTRWDANNLYVAAEVPDNHPDLQAPLQEEPYLFPFMADSLQLAIGGLKNNPDHMLRDWPMYEKSGADDVDYEFCATLAHSSTGRNIPQLHRLAAPGTNKQSYYLTNAVTDPPTGVMDASPTQGSEGRIAIVYDDKAHVFRYEIAIGLNQLGEPGRQIQHLKPGEKMTIHLAMKVNDAGTDGRGGTAWTTEAGDDEPGSYGFSPHWGGGQAANGGRIITDWGFVR